MTNVAMFLGGFAAGAVVTSLFEQRAVNEVVSLRAYLRAELQKLGTKL